MGKFTLRFREIWNHPRFKKQWKGSISLFMSMIILLLVILEGFLIDGSKVLAGKLFMSSAGDMALNAGLTYYEKALKDIYGLFAISQTEEELTKNLEVYFRQTIGDASGTADFGYVDEMLEYIETAIQSGWDGESAGKLLDLNMGTFSAKGVPGSQLSETYVLRNQILEYMKYRGPASLGYGMLEKLHVFKEMDRQQKTMEAKLNYEETMSDVQKACEKAYENIEPYNKLLEGPLKPETVEEVSYRINRNIRDAVLAVWCYQAVCENYNTEPFPYKIEWKKQLANQDHNVAGAVDRLGHMTRMMVACDSAESCLRGDFSQHVHGTMSAIQVILGYREDYKGYQQLYTAWQNYQAYFQEEMDRLGEALSSAEEDEEGEIEAEIEALEEEYEEYENAYKEAETQINRFPKILDLAKDTLKRDIHTRMTAAVQETKQLEDSVKKLIQLGEYGTDGLEDIQKSIRTLESKGNVWQSSIWNLSPGDIKTSMQSDYDNKAKDLDTEKLELLKTRLEKGIAYGKVLEKGIESASAVTEKLTSGGRGDYGEWLRVRMKSTPAGNDTTSLPGERFSTFISSYWEENANKNSAMEMNLTANGNSPSGTIYLLEAYPGGKNKGAYVQMNLSVYENDWENIWTGKDEFFQYLERICPKSEAENQSKEEANQAKKELLEKGDQKDIKVSGLPSLSTDATGASGEGSGKFTSTDQNADDKKISKTAKENTKGSADFMSGIGDLLVSGRDKLYLSEYATQMFSYYTVEKMTKPSDKETLSGYPFSSENNLMYQAEVEYILWGNPDGNKDVQYTLATIFGIRFLLNSLYAFTGDPEIRQVSLALATSIAGWTGFGVPLVQSVIILSFALAETALDMQELKDGKSVPIYKSKSNWVIKPSGISKEAMHNAVNRAAGAAKEYITDQLNQLTENTKEQFRTKLEEYTKTTITDVTAAASAAVLNPLQERIIGMIHVVSASKEDIQGRIDECLQKMDTAIQAEGDSVMEKAKKRALDYAKSNIRGDLIPLIESLQNSDLDNGEITKKVYDRFKSYEQQMEASLTSFVSPLVQELSGSVNKALDSGNEDLQKRTSEALDQMMIRVNCGISFADTSSVNVDGGRGRTAGAAALTINYKEYLWMFIAVKSVANEEDMLKRMGNLIQANLAESKAKPVEGFQIGKAYTFIEVKADADLSTTFFAMPVPMKGGGGVSLGQDKYNIGYRGVIGY